MGLKTVAKRSGVSTGTLSKLMFGVYAPGPGGRNGKGDLVRPPSRRVLRETAEKLYALDPAWSEKPLQLADGAVLDAESSAQVQRKLQSLVALGWSMSELGRRLDISWSRNAIPVIKGERRILVVTARKAEALFAELSMTLPPETTKVERQVAARSRAFARAHGWVPPLDLEDLASESSPAAAMDDVDLDEVAIERRMAGDKYVRLTRAEQAELVRRWRATGRSLADCERTTGIQPHRVASAATKAAS